MSVYKQLLAQDIIVTPFEVNKSFTFNGIAQITGSGIDSFLGTNISGLFSPLSDAKTGCISAQYQRLVYNSIKELYYSNYLSSSYGSPIPTASLIPGSIPSGNTIVGDGTPSPSFYNYLSTTLSYPHFWPTASNATIGVLAIPSRLFGDKIKPTSLVYTNSDGTYTDDGEGNLIFGGNIVGNVIYQHGMAVLTSASAGAIINFTTASACSFISSYSIFETQYKCTIRESEFNFTQNPSIISGSTTGVVLNFVTGSYFAPYITTVGLYDDNQNLIAVGKLSQPLPSSRTTDMTIYVNIDR